MQRRDGLLTLYINVNGTGETHRFQCEMRHNVNSILHKYMTARLFHWICGNKAADWVGIQWHEAAWVLFWKSGE